MNVSLNRKELRMKKHYSSELTGSRSYPLGVLLAYRRQVQASSRVQARPGELAWLRWLAIAMLALVGLAVVLSMQPGIARAEAAPLKLDVLDISERTLDDAPALAVLFNAPLDARQRYDGYLSVTDDKDDAVKGAWVLGDDKRTLYFPAIEPAKTYTVRVRRGMSSARGAVLTEAVERTVKTRPLPPSYGFASRGVVLPARLSDGLPVMVVNVPEVDIQFLRVKDSKLAPFINEFLRDTRLSRWELPRLTQFTESVYLMRFTTGAKRNARTVTHIPVEDIKQLKDPGIYVAVMTRPGDFGYNAERIAHFFVSDIGLHVRAYADATNVYASSLASSRALPNVDVELFDNMGKSIEKARTDVHGIAHFVGRPQANQVLIARAGAHLSLVSFREPALDLSEFDAETMYLHLLIDPPEMLDTACGSAVPAAG